MKRAAVVLAIAAASIACSKKDDAPKTIEVHERIQPGPLVPPTSPASAASAPGAPPAFDESAFATGEPEPAAGSASVAPAASAPRPSPPAANPDDPILASTHAALGRCFAALRAGPNAGPPRLDAQVAVTVMPSGRVIRSEVPSSDVSDPDVLDCLHRTADGARFSDNDGGPLRTYTIDVRLVAR